VLVEKAQKLKELHSIFYSTLINLASSTHVHLQGGVDRFFLHLYKIFYDINILIEIIKMGMGNFEIKYRVVPSIYHIL